MEVFGDHIGVLVNGRRGTIIVMVEHGIFVDTQAKAMGSLNELKKVLRGSVICIKRARLEAIAKVETVEGVIADRKSAATSLFARWQPQGAVAGVYDLR